MRKTLFAFATVIAACQAFALRATDPVEPDSPWQKSWWPKRFAEKQELVKAGGAPVVFLGDSITHNWENQGRLVWDKYFAEGPYRALNLGFGADRTEHVLWRIDNGEFDGYEAKAIVLMIGTNNTGHFSAVDETPADTIIGIKAIIDRLRAKQPGAKIVLCPIFPRGEKPTDERRVRNSIVNKEICKFADGRHVLWCDFTDQFLLPDGTLRAEVAPDYLHPARWAYEIWASAVMPFLDYALRGGDAPFPSRYSTFQNPALTFDRPLTVTPATRLCEGRKGAADQWWLERLAERRGQIAAAKGEFDLVFVGDSITQGWEGGGREVLDRLSKTYRILDLGYNGDRTQHVIWRLQNGELDGYSAKLVMLMIGTNNYESPEDVAAGVKRILEIIRYKQPRAKTVLLPIFPRDEKPDGGSRRKNDRINAIIKGFANGRTVVWADFTEKFLGPDGTLPKEMFPDLLHPNKSGYEIWAKEMEPYFKEACAPAQAKAEWRPAERWRGFNLLEMFIWEQGIKYPVYREEDFRQIKEWGFNFVRLPIDYRYWTHGGDWNRIDEEWVKPVDRAIELGGKYGLHVQVCLHRAPGYCINRCDLEPEKLFEGSENARRAFVKHWTFLAKRYADIPKERLSFDLVNEPPNVPEQTYLAGIMGAVDAIRAVSPDRMVFSDGRDGGNVPTVSLAGEPGLSQAMRGYLPMPVSHYLADWTPGMTAMPTWPLERKGGKARYDDPSLDWIYVNNFKRWDALAEKGVFVMMGEFGVYNKTPHDIALKMVEANLKLLKERGWGWALWNFRGDFGPLDSKRSDVDYEDFGGHKLDRKMLDLLRKY